jgi:hypothetical protein
MPNIDRMRFLHFSVDRYKLLCKNLSCVFLYFVGISTCHVLHTHSQFLIQLNQSCNIVLFVLKKNMGDTMKKYKKYRYTYTVHIYGLSANIMYFCVCNGRSTTG